MPGSPIIFFILAAIAVLTAVGMLVSRNTIYSALFLVLNFATVAVLYLILGAPFIALAQITVYAGSIMVLFLFVIMLLGAERLAPSTQLRWQPVIAIPVGVFMVVIFAYQLFRSAQELPVAASLPADFGNPATIGRVLFTEFTLPFEVTGVILLAATVGAILLAQPDKPSVGQQVRYAENIERQEEHARSTDQQPILTEEEHA